LNSLCFTVSPYPRVREHTVNINKNVYIFKP
jgi:hypothetical protein